MNVYAIYFSPTGSTEKIVKEIADEFGDYQEFDLSRRKMHWLRPLCEAVSGRSYPAG